MVDGLSLTFKQSLGPGGMAGKRQLLDNKISLIDGLPFDFIGEWPLIVIKGLFSLIVCNPMAVNALDNLRAKNLLTFERWGKCIFY